jgi:AcrR family transcriptional regulator
VPTKDLILSTAAAVLAESGYESTTLEAVAARAGVTKATIYYHFDSKEEIYAAVLRRYLREALSRLEAHVSSGKPIEEILVDVLTSFIDDTMDPERRYVFYQEIVRSNERNSANIRDAQRAFERALAAFVRTAQEAGVLMPGDPGVIAFLIVGSIGRTARWFRPDGRVPADEFRATLMRMLLGGFVAESKARKRLGLD